MAKPLTRRARAALGGAILALTPALFACTPETADAPITFKVERQKLVFSRSFYGELVARKSIAIYTPELSGVYQLTIESLKDDGTRIKKGDVVLEFSTGLLEDELQDFEAQLAVAKAELHRLSETLDRERIELTLAVRRAVLGVERARLNVISGVNLISKLDLEKAKIELKQAQLALSLAKQAVRTFAKKRHAALEVERLKAAAILEKAKEKRQQMAAAKVKAPADGVLYAPYTRLNWVRGKVAPGSVTRPGDKILEIPDLSSFDVALFVRQRDATLLRVGDIAAVYPTVLPSQRIEAKVVKKEPFATTRNERLGMREPSGNLKEVKVLLRLARSFPELRPGGTVRADVDTLIADNVPVVPLVALKEGEKGYTAQLLTGRRVDVRIGRVTSTHAEVLGGLSVGDAVLLPRAEQVKASSDGGVGGKGKRRGRRGKGRKGRKKRGGARH